MAAKLGARVSCAKQNHTYIALTNEPPKRFAHIGEAYRRGVQQLSYGWGKNG
jgi:hypothetical protein